MKVKEIAKKTITEYADLKFQKGLEGKAISFDEWIRDKESSLERFDMTVDCEGSAFNSKDFSTLSYSAKYEAATIRIVPYTLVNASFKISNYIEDIIVFVNGELTDKAIPLLAKAFGSNPDINVAYGDEDIAELDFNESNRYGRSMYGTRRDPYFKPEWSPNAFLDHFYFCNMVAVRRSAFRNIEWDLSSEGAPAIYNALLKYIFASEHNLRKSVEHIDAILVHARNYELNYLTDTNAEELSKEFLALPTNKTRISVVIPSKDNPELIKKCLSSLKETFLGNVSYEVIIVDNGTSKEKFSQIETLSAEFGFKWIYEPMEFNFAAMINKGVAAAKNDIVLLLNDDITFTEPGTLLKLAKQVKYRFTGAVGLKLLYPDSKMIQHAGVINNRIGPVHKLQFMDDSKDYYQGFNKLVQNVSAVTAACLMIRKDVFLKVRGMNESLKVAFNDIDLCFKLIENGYANTVCNNISAYHAESVTRGHDTDELSIVRLNSEKERLYTLHPLLRNFDPYYSKRLLNDCLDVRIVPANEYEYRRACETVARLKKFDLSTAKEEPCVQLSLEYAGDMSGFADADDESADAFSYFQGFAYVLGSDNSLYRKSLVLKSDKETFVLNYKGAFRSDVAAFCKDQKNVELAGFSVKLKKGMLDPGKYRVGVLFENRYAREKLYVFSNKYLSVKVK